MLSSSLAICRTLNLREKSLAVPRSSETAAAWRLAARGLVRLRKIFLPHIPGLGTKVFHSFNSLRPAPLNRFSG